MDDLISRKDAVKAIKKMAWENDNKFGNARNILLDGAKELDSLPSAQPDLLEDGTLLITVPQGMLEKVKRVMVDEFDTKFCKVMYQDEPELQGEWVDAKDGYDGHVKCNKCFKTYDWTRDAQYFDYCPNCGSYNGGGR